MNTENQSDVGSYDYTHSKELEINEQFPTGMVKEKTTWFEVFKSDGWKLIVITAALSVFAGLVIAGLIWLFLERS